MLGRGWLAALVLLCVAGLVWLAWDREASEPAAASGKRVRHRAAPASRLVRPTRDEDDNAPRRRHALRLRAWVYAIDEPLTESREVDGYVLDWEAGDTSLEAIRVSVGGTLHSGRRRVAVLEAEGARVPLRLDEDRDLAPTLERKLAEADASSTFHVVDVASDQPMTVLLVDGDGTPYGPLWSGLRIALPVGFRGLALASGYLPAKVAIDRGAVTWQWVAMRRGSHVRGRLEGQHVAAGARLLLGDLDAPPQVATDPAVDVAEVNADGSFEIGPIAAGRRRLRYDGEGAWLAREARIVELRPGHQDLGTLRLLAAPDLHLRVFGDGGSLGGRAFVTVWFAGQEPPARLGITERELPPNGMLCLPRVRGVPLRASVWTRSGWFGSAEPLLAEETSAEHPAPVHLLPPGALMIRASTAPHPLPAGCRVLVSPGVFQPGQLRLLARATNVDSERVRLADVRPGGWVVLESLWPGLQNVALLSPEGALLAQRDVEVASGARGTVDLSPDDTLAELVVENAADRARRFAVLSDERGVVLRGEAPAAGSSRVLLPPGEYRVVALGAQGAAREPASALPTTLSVAEGQTVHWTL